MEIRRRWWQVKIIGIKEGHPFGGRGFDSEVSAGADAAIRAIGMAKQAAMSVELLAQMFGDGGS